MNKVEFVDALAAKTGLSKKDARIAADSFLDVIREALSAGKKVQFMGFGSFDVREAAARKGRNPQTGEEIKIPAHKHVVFHAGKSLNAEIDK